MNEERRISGARRPIAWLVTVVLVYLADLGAELLCMLGQWIVDFLGQMTPFQIVISVALCGGIFTSLVIYTITAIPQLIIILCEKIYPTHHAFRYYFVGVLEIIGCALFVLLGIRGLISGGNMFWFYARCAYIAIRSLVLMLFGREIAEGN